MISVATSPISAFTQSILMADLSKGLVQPFLGALQACISVLLTLLYGVITRHVSLINDETIDQMSGICVKIFLPALILVKLGSELSLDIALHYVPVLGTFPLPFLRSFVVEG